MYYIGILSLMIQFLTLEDDNQFYIKYSNCAGNKIILVY